MRKQRYWRMLLTAAFLFLLAPQAAQAAITPTTVQKLLASDSVIYDFFGQSVAVSGDTAMIGAPWDDDQGDMSGSVYVFVRSADSTWTLQTILLASDGADSDYFGWSVALSGDTAVIGTNTDSAYVFVRAAEGSWTQQAKLTAQDGANGCTNVALSGDTAVIGMNNSSAYVFVRAADGTWTQQAKLLAQDDAAPSGFFRLSVALDGDTAVIGAAQYYNDQGPQIYGSAYVFVRAADSTWTQQAKLTADDGAAGDQFGWSVALDGDTAVIGAIWDDDQGEQSGSAYVFIRSADSTWTQQAKLLGQDGSAGFGSSVAVSGDIAVIGAYGYNHRGIDAGSAYVFVRAADSTWTQQAKLTADDGTTGDWFGISVAIVRGHGSDRGNVG